MELERFQPVQFKKDGKVYAAYVAGTYPGNPRLIDVRALPSFHDSHKFKGTLFEEVPFSPTPKEGHWSPVPEVNRG